MALTPLFSLEETRPRLVDGVEFIPFDPQVTFLKNARIGEFLKLSAHEASLSRYFNGKFTFVKILLKHVEARGSSHLLNIAEILPRLKTSGFIVDETGERDPEEKVLESGVSGALKE